MPEDKDYLDYKIFRGADAKDVGGETGSKKVKVGDNFYQLKKSVLDAKFSRKLKSGYADQENFGEFIASAICRGLTESHRDCESVPKVSLVYDQEEKKVLVASRYLENIADGDLYAYARNRLGTTYKKKLIIALGDTDPVKSGELFLGGQKDQKMRMDICRAIALSSIVGDHDINAGNLVVVKDSSNKTRVARIDLGHAFNDLLRFSSIIGGSVRNKSNQVLDFFNRETVSHIFPYRQKSKLWRHYKGVVPSLEMAEALEEVSKASGLEKGLNEAKASFVSLLNELLKDPKVNARLIDHIKRSLIHISSAISSDKVSFNLHPQNVVDKVFSNIEKFCADNQRKMMDVSMLMRMQTNLDKMIDDKSRGQPIDEAKIEEIKLQYTAFQAKDGIVCSKGIRWIKIDEKVPAFEGDIQGYIKQRSKVLGCDSSLSKAFSLEGSQKKFIAVKPAVKVAERSFAKRLLGFLNKIKEFFRLSDKERTLHSMPVSEATKVPKPAPLTSAEAASILRGNRLTRSSRTRRPPVRRNPSGVVRPL